MEEFCKIIKFLRNSYKNDENGQYVAYLTDSFTVNYVYSPKI